MLQSNIVDLVHGRLDLQRCAGTASVLASALCGKMSGDAVVGQGIKSSYYNQVMNSAQALQQLSGHHAPEHGQGSSTRAKSRRCIVACSAPDQFTASMCTTRGAWTTVYTLEQGNLASYKHNVEQQKNARGGADSTQGGTQGRREGPWGQKELWHADAGKRMANGNRTGHR